MAALSAGDRLGVYELGSPLGAGGMGEVYRAKDTKLGRDVALKILPASFTNDPERVARFRREAQVLASLNHPHIAQIHGLEESNGTQFLVLELVDGESLDKRIARGPIRVDEALGIAKQIAEALEAAHEKGIIHRDLKPANVALTNDGQVKVLDFGLAKAVEGASASGDLSMSPTITSPAMMTGVGVILGTAAYMSPEQAKGRPADKRSDIWAFGCVLYEMLTGRPPFAGEDTSEVLARIIERDPDFQALPPRTPQAILRLLRRTLEKDRKRRLADVSDARIEIDDALAATPPETIAAIAPGARVRKGILWALGATAVLAIGALAIPATLYFRRAVPEPMVTRFDVVTPPTTDAFSFALSPDGRQLVFVANGDNGSQLWLRPLDQIKAQPLAGTAGASYPFWAPDGRVVGFFADFKLKRVDITGAGLQMLADAASARGGTWNADGVIVFAPAVAAPLLRVPASGGTVAPVTRLVAGQGSHRWPQFLPDGRRFLFLMATGQPEAQGVYVGSLDGREPTRVMPAATAATYAPPGYLLLVSQGVLAAYPFDAARATVEIEPIRVDQPVGADDGAFHSAFSVSAQGVLAHRSGAAARRQLVWVDRTGKVLGTVGQPDENALGNPALAPDGHRVAVTRVAQGNADVWLMDLGLGVPSRFTFDPTIDSAPIWSPDGSQVIFRSTRNGTYDLFEKPTTGTADEHPLLETPQAKSPLDWSPDGRFLLYSVLDPKTGSDLWALPLTGERKPFAVLQSSFDEIEGQFSPNGQWLAYASNESGRYEVYVRPFPEAGEKRQVSAAGGTQPRWRRDGHELFYVAPDGRLMAVPISPARGTQALEARSPVPLFQTRLASGANLATAGFQARPQYDVARDGRFLMLINSNDALMSPITIVQNWQAALSPREQR
jgi:Tol biopolymer transport system component